MHLTIFGRSTNEMRHISPPPGKQGSYTRWSLVFFTRPGNSQVLRLLAEDSALIADAAAKDTTGRFNMGATASEWFARRIKNQRIKNRTVRVPVDFIRR